MKIKSLIVLSFLVCAQAWAAYPMVSLGNDHTCAIDSEGMKCWGIRFPLEISSLKSPSQIDSGIESVCVLDIEGVKCWGVPREELYAGPQKPWIQLEVPPLKSPIQVSAGDGICAIDAEGLKCWGFGAQVNIKDIENFAKSLKTPTQVSVGRDLLCAIDAEGVKCEILFDDYVDRNIPKLKFPRQVSVGSNHACALDAEGVKCWGNNSFGQLEVPPLKKPTQLTAGSFHTCALDAEGVKCWGDNQYGPTKDAPTLKSPTQVSAGGSYTCAVDLDGVKCWSAGNNTFLPLCVSTSCIPIWYMRDFVRETIPLATPVRAMYLKGIAEVLQTDDLDTTLQYLQFLLSTPAITSMDSEYFNRNIIPTFKKRSEKIQKDLGYSDSTDGFKRIPDNQKSRGLAVSSIHTALSVGLNFIALELQASVQTCIHQTENVQLDSLDNRKIRELIKCIDSLTVEKQNLKSTLKTAFLVDSLELATSWLREKVK